MLDDRSQIEVGFFRLYLFYINPSWKYNILQARVCIIYTLYQFYILREPSKKELTFLYIVFFFDIWSLRKSENKNTKKKNSPYKTH